MGETTEKTSGGVSANRSVSRAISVLRALAVKGSGQTVTEIAKRVQLPRATVFRLLLTLEEEGFVDRQDTMYFLGWDLARIAQDVDPTAGLVSRVSDVVEEIADAMNETVTLSVRRGKYDLDLVQQAAPRSIGVTMSDMKGMRWPLHASATGKLLLAELDRDEIRVATGNKLEKLTPVTITTWKGLEAELEAVRDQGWASTVDELEEGIISVAVPLRGAGGDLVASLAYIAPRHRIGTDKIETQKINELLDGAQRVRQRIVSLTDTLPATR
ncbi:IclR family transcriptional regulator [Glutamicibacter sp.]|uniref:IclR family transcriptional regulator n=1 Tax=Glutamicibacter sp. TaxID=1931995 RepID=UPI0028BD2986|nr:IclR family transcriptional regulator [Glutamicibacter sp.]